MQKGITKDTVIHAYGHAMIASWLLEYCGRIFQKDNKFYKQANKTLVKKLLDNNAEIFTNVEKVRSLTHPDINKEWAKKKLESLDLDAEVVDEEIGLQLELIGNFVSLYLNASPAELFDFWLIVQNIKAGKKVYTQEEVDDLLRIQEPEALFAD